MPADRANASCAAREPSMGLVLRRLDPAGPASSRRSRCGRALVGPCSALNRRPVHDSVTLGAVERLFHRSAGVTAPRSISVRALDVTGIRPTRVRSRTGKSRSVVHDNALPSMANVHRKEHLDHIGCEAVEAMQRRRRSVRSQTLRTPVEARREHVLVPGTRRATNRNTRGFTRSRTPLRTSRRS